jgi:hypothetical protein
MRNQVSTRKVEHRDCGNILFRLFLMQLWFLDSHHVEFAWAGDCVGLNEMVLAYLAFGREDWRLGSVELHRMKSVAGICRTILEHVLRHD